MKKTTQTKRNLTTASSEQTKHLLTGVDGYYLEYDDVRLIDIEVGGSACIYGFSDSELLAAKNRFKPTFIRNELDETSEDIRVLVERLTYHSQGLEGIAWTCSGSDSVESAIAISDTHWKVMGQDRPLIATMSNCYHGTTYLTKSLRGKRKVPWVRNVLLDSPDWTDIDQRAAQEQKILDSLVELGKTNPAVGAVLLETMPWNSAYYPWSMDFLKQVRSICDTYDFNLILDDVAMGFGKQGAVFTHTLYGVVPDVVAMGKAITNGLVPFGLAMANTKLTSAVANDPAWSQIHTWCPSVDGVAIARTMIEKLEQDLHLVDSLADRFKTIAQSQGLPIRGQGLLWEVLKPADPERFYNAGLMTEHGLDQSVKFVIPLIADDHYFQTLEAAFRTIFD
jgi:adenosylmethionine-8-amino-7-oxononanoate aminotransferase